MTYDPVKRLRSQIGDDLQEVYSLEALFRLAADKIEQLTTERDVSNELGKALEEDAGQLRAERDRLREALRDGRRLLAIAQDDRVRLLIQIEQCEKHHE